MFENRHLKNSLGLVAVFFLTIFIAASCSDNSTGNNSSQKPLQNVITVKNLDAHTGNRGKAGKYTFFSLKNNKIVLKESASARSDSATTKWDIAFSGRTIIANGGNNGPGNGGILFLDVPFTNVKVAPSKGYQTGLKWKSWANYTGRNKPKHALLPKDNTTIVVRTADGDHVAKIKIISWIKALRIPRARISKIALAASRATLHSDINLSNKRLVQTQLTLTNL